MISKDNTLQRVSSKLMPEGDVQPSKRYLFPFSPYQFVLFFFDVIISITSFYLIASFSMPRAGISGPDIVSLMIAALMLISFFPVHGLYSYHLIFYKKPHIAQLAKAFCWFVFMFGVMTFLYRWPVIFRQHPFLIGTIIFVGASGLTVLGRVIYDHIGNFVMAAGISFIAVGINGLILGDRVPIFIERPAMTGISFAVAVIFICIMRCFLITVVYGQWLRRHFRRQMLVVGTGSDAQKITDYIVDTDAPFWVAGVISDGDIVSEEEKLYSKPRFGKLDDLPMVVAEHRINEIIVTDKSMEKKRLIELLDYCLSNGIVAWFSPSLLPIIPMKLQIDTFCSMPMIRLCVQRWPAFFSFIKRIMDLILSSCGLILLSPLFCVIAVAIKRDSEGPVFYKAVAVGEMGRTFRMFKFRSMRTDGDSSIHKDFVKKFIRGEIPEKNKKEGVLKITDDPRVTSVGRILRKYSLDELPQLINVLKGDMSLVGPRPCLPYEYEEYKDWHCKRNSVRPGITGLWQVTGRSEVMFEDMILLDIYYIYNRGLLLDLAILFETVFVVISKKGAW